MATILFSHIFEFYVDNSMLFILPSFRYIRSVEFNANHHDIHYGS